MIKDKPYRLMISGGGTGGHIFPAIAIANAFKERYPKSEILFIGAKGRMEMTRVPEAGYEIIGLWISGIQRSLSLSNLLFPIKLLWSYIKADNIIKTFKPDVVIGTGGFASGPTMMVATRRKIPTLIQEQNSYAGLTNKKLGNKVDKICVAYDGMDKYFPKKKIILTGNPVRQDLNTFNQIMREKAYAQFAFSSSEKTLLVLGGSLGSRNINESIIAHIDKLIDAQVQVIWQTGKLYFEEMKKRLQGKDLRRIRMHEFLTRMNLSYAAADLVISRAGAISISELCIVKKPVIFVPSSNVAEDHQAKNAEALEKKSAAIIIQDKDAKENLVKDALALLYDEQKLKTMADNIGALARPDATKHIVDEIEKLIK